MKLAVLAVFIVVFAQHPSKTPNTKGTAESSPTKVAEQPNRAHDNKKQSADRLTIPNQTILYDQQRAAPETKNGEAEAQQNAQIQGRIAVFTRWLVVVGFLQALILGFQWWAIRQQARHFQNSERAWVMVELKCYSGSLKEIDLGNDHRTLLSTHVFCVNKGKTPSWIIEKGHVFKIVDSLPQEPDYADIDIFQNEPEPIAQDAETEISIEPMCDGWRGENGKRMVIIYGFVRYRDIFDKTRITRFGYSVNIDMVLERLTGYPEYNKNI